MDWREALGSPRKVRILCFYKEIMFGSRTSNDDLLVQVDTEKQEQSIDSLFHTLLARVITRMKFELRESKCYTELLVQQVEDELGYAKTGRSLSSSRSLFPITKSYLWDTPTLVDLLGLLTEAQVTDPELAECFGRFLLKNGTHRVRSNNYHND